MPEVQPLQRKGVTGINMGQAFLDLYLTLRRAWERMDGWMDAWVDVWVDK
jgi:hypothetical protein